MRWRERVSMQRKAAPSILFKAASNSLDNAAIDIFHFELVQRLVQFILRHEEALKEERGRRQGREGGREGEKAMVGQTSSIPSPSPSTLSLPGHSPSHALSDTPATDAQLHDSPLAFSKSTGFFLFV